MNTIKNKMIKKGKKWTYKFKNKKDRENTLKVYIYIYSINFIVFKWII